MSTPATRPSFFVQIDVGTHMGTPAPRLKWAAPGYGGSIQRRLALAGRYACFPVHSGGALVEPVVSLPLQVAKDIREAFDAGAVLPETLQALAAAIREAE